MPSQPPHWQRKPNFCWSAHRDVPYEMKISLPLAMSLIAVKVMTPRLASQQYCVFRFEWHAWLKLEAMAKQPSPLPTTKLGRGQ